MKDIKISIAMVLLGIIIAGFTILHQTGTITLNKIVITWWPIILIIAGVVFFIQKPWSGEAISCTLIGVIFLIKQLDLLSASTVMKLFWPIVIIIIGLSYIFGKSK